VAVFFTAMFRIFFSFSFLIMGGFIVTTVNCYLDDIVSFVSWADGRPHHGRMKNLMTMMIPHRCSSDGETHEIFSYVSSFSSSSFDYGVLLLLQ
jgi:hypothetical protein